MQVSDKSGVEITTADNLKMKEKIIEGERENTERRKPMSLTKRLSKTYTYDVSQLGDIMRLLLEGGKISLPPCKRPEEEFKTNDPKYCPYHRIVGHTLKDCYVLKDKVQELINVGAITLEVEDKKVTTNSVSICFGSFDPITTTFEGSNDPDVEFRYEPLKAPTKDLVPYNLSDGSFLWVHPNFLKDED